MNFCFHFLSPLFELHVPPILKLLSYSTKENWSAECEYAYLNLLHQSPKLLLLSLKGGVMEAAQTPDTAALKL